jgi:hypothetical protein
MNRAEAEFILGPIILGFEVAKGRARELLEKSQEQGLSRDRLHELIRHESDLEQALKFILAREKAWAVDGIMQAVDTGSTIATWPSVMPGSDFRDRTIAAWKESRNPNPANIQPLQRPA